MCFNSGIRKSSSGPRLRTASHVSCTIATLSNQASGTLPATLLSYAQRESQEVASFEEQLATWLPRLLYVAVALWMAYGIVTGGGFSPQLPADLL